MLRDSFYKEVVTFSKCWCKYTVTHTNSTNKHNYSMISVWYKYERTHNNSTNKHNYSMNSVFANHSEEEENFPLTVKEIAEAQGLDKFFKATTIKEKYDKTLIKNTPVFCKNGKLVIPRSLQHRAVSWYHHYLQHPGNTRLEETLRAAMYWKHMHSTVRSYVKNCKSCQVNK